MFGPFLSPFWTGVGAGAWGPVLGEGGGHGLSPHVTGHELRIGGWKDPGEGVGSGAAGGLQFVRRGCGAPPSGPCFLREGCQLPGDPI